MFNAGLEGNARRAIDFFEGDQVDQRALTALVRAAIDYNRNHLKKNARGAQPKPGSKKSSGQTDTSEA